MQLKITVKNGRCNFAQTFFAINGTKNVGCNLAIDKFRRQWLHLKELFSNVTLQHFFVTHVTFTECDHQAYVYGTDFDTLHGIV